MDGIIFFKEDAKKWFILYNPRFNHRAADGGEGVGEAGEVGVIVVGADNGAAGAGEFGGGARGAGGENHVAVGVADVENAVAEVEVGVHERGKAFGVSGCEGVKGLLREVGKLGHGGHDVGFLFFEEDA